MSEPRLDSFVLIYCLPAGDPEAWSTLIVTLEDQNTCLEQIEQQEQKRGQKYTWLVRLRADLAWQGAPIQVPDDLPPVPSVLVPKLYSDPQNEIVISLATPHGIPHHLTILLPSSIH